MFLQHDSNMCSVGTTNWLLKWEFICCLIFNHIPDASSKGVSSYYKEENSYFMYIALSPIHRFVATFMKDNVVQRVLDKNDILCFDVFTNRKRIMGKVAVF